jgi:hypothetical protein
MNEKFKITALKLTTSSIRTVDLTELVEAELLLTFKLFNKENYLYNTFMNATKQYVTEQYWKSEANRLADFEEFDIDKMDEVPQFTRLEQGVTSNISYLTYKPKFDTFIYHKFFTWNLVTQATIQQIKLLEAGLNSHYMYEEATTLLACLQTLNSWET